MEDNLSHKVLFLGINVSDTWEYFYYVLSLYDGICCDFTCCLNYICSKKNTHKETHLIYQYFEEYREGMGSISNEQAS